MIDLTDEIVAMQSSGHPRKVGRYYASSLYGMLKPSPWLRPEDYLKVEQFDQVSAIRMWQGTWKHRQVQEILERMGWENEVKAEWSPPDKSFTLVGKLDAIKGDDILEIKTTNTVLDYAKPWQEHQAKLYCTMHQKPRCHIVQPITDSGRVVLHLVTTVLRDDDFFQQEMKRLAKYHAKVLKLHGVQPTLNAQ